MVIDNNILKKFSLKNEIRTLFVIDTLEKEIEKNQKELEEKSRLIEQKQDLLNKCHIDNDYYNIVLPSQIEELGLKRIEIIASNISKTLELNRAKEQGNMYNFDKNISQFVFNHLRNSLAHGYIKFQNNLDLSNASDMIITFEDYNPNNKNELTFKGFIKLNDLLAVITSEQYVNNVLEINSSNHNSFLSKNKQISNN